MTNTPEQTLSDLLARIAAFRSGDVGMIQVATAANPAEPALRSALERLSAYEEAVGAAVWLLDRIEADFPEIRDDYRDSTGWDAKVARLRALQEK